MEDDDIGEETGVHPMDAFLGIFHSSDIFLRRYLATRLSECQLSVPFLLPDPMTGKSENVTMLLSALQNITKSWKSGSGNNESVQEVFATLHPFPVVSFIRLGQPTMSKSLLINKIMSDRDSYHNFFFHKDMEGGDVARKVVDGLVELSWYLPKGKPKAILKREICFANLRGEATIFKKQLKVLSKISSTLCIVLPSARPDQTMQNILNRFARNNTKVILLFNEKIMKSGKKYFDKLKSSSNEKFSLITKAEKGNEYDYLKTIREGIRKKIDGVKARPLVKISLRADEYEIQLEDDQIDSEFKAMIDSLLEKGIERVKKLMTLQIHIPVLAGLEREMHRPKRHGNKFIKEDNNEIYEKVKKSKEAQKTSLKHLDKDILNCLNHITMMDELERHKALNMLKHRLESRSNASLGLEHVIRELAQLYQIKRNTKDSAGENECDYAGAAADMLLSGQPLELVDGDHFYIPLEWFNAVCTKLKEKTNDAKIFVVSVVGIQSSGKSTMLNTMFGLEFPVSAGRCTKGVFASLLPVSDSLKSTSKFDYVLVVDTEGLRGLSDPQVRERDNELVVFAIGLADVTLVNIKGEISNDMKDFLETAVHAFLKMKLADANKMSCRIVHQDVADPGANTKLEGDRIDFIKNLDEMTKNAAIQENCNDKYKKFNDVISFNEKEDVFYLPTLHLGNPPMAPVNPQYGRGIQTIKNGIIDLMCLTNSNENVSSRHSVSDLESSHHSVSDFQKRVTNIWKALQEEHFIFSLRNTIELRARRSLDEKYLEVSVSVMLTGMAKLEEQIDVALRRCLTAVQREEEWAESEKEIHSKAKELEKEMKKAMDFFFVNDKDSTTLYKWRGAISEEIEKEKERQVTKVKDHCFKTLLYLRRIQDIERKKNTYQEKVMEKAKEFIISVHHIENKAKLEAIFLQEWQRWISDVPKLQEVKIDVIDEMVGFVLEKYPDSSEDELAEYKNIISNFQNGGIADQDLIYNIGFLKMFFFGRKIRKDCIARASAIKKKVVDMAKDFSQVALESGVRFTRDNLKQMYENVTTSLDEETKKYLFEFKTSSKRNILVSSFAQSHQYFDEMEDRFLQEQDIRGNLEITLRPQLKNYFENVYEKRNKEYLAAFFFVNVLKKEIESALAQRMGKLVADDISRSSEFKDKGKFHAKILIKLGEDKNFQSYVRYLEDPVEFLKTKLEESIENHCLHTILPATVSLFGNEVNKIKEQILTAIRIADDKTRKREGKLTFWIQQFVEVCSTIIVKKEMFAVAAIVDLDEISVFQASDQIINNLNQYIDSLIEGGVNLATFRKWNPSPHKFIFDEMFACQCLCPFCKALCDGNKGHKTHSTQSHRPVGIVGQMHERTRKLVTNFCTECVAGNKTFRSLDTFYEPCYYRDYRSVNDYYGSWVIAGNKSLKPSMYWKWFMATFWKELADVHGVTPAKPNFFWRFISFYEAKEQLMRDYDL
ncbi:LOW QUALITY PROTEIN: interferon-induced very large GTPase 1-like [Dendronephthya gigantea]|uniref:LOW QUALITY PROTEIN: interferon-induced very large GTPase 1-like n=1 Tax=Dendronephthya gigantea TaxID=151771 RepID=UPI001068D4C2|nr:LOW QUALITY PROTEIN: interferon-induced very large GTPase 1-like [Dendronephthya gigantea]